MNPTEFMLTEVSNTNEYGFSYIRKEHFEAAMKHLGLEKAHSNRCTSSSRLTFRGSLYGVKIVLHCSTCTTYTGEDGTDKFCLIQSADPTMCKTFTHYHVKSNIPTNVQLSGPGARIKGWLIFYDILAALEPDEHDSISYRDCDLF